MTTKKSMSVAKWRAKNRASYNAYMNRWNREMSLNKREQGYSRPRTRRSSGRPITRR